MRYAPIRRRPPARSTNSRPQIRRSRPSGFSSPRNLFTESPRPGEVGAPGVSPQLSNQRFSRGIGIQAPGFDFGGKPVGVIACLQPLSQLLLCERLDFAARPREPARIQLPRLTYGIEMPVCRLDDGVDALALRGCCHENRGAPV